MRYHSYPSLSDSNHAVEILERFRHGLNNDGEYEYDRDISDMIQMLDSPLFKQICNVQDSLQEFGECLKERPDLQPDDFDFTPTGELHLFEGKFGLKLFILWNSVCGIIPFWSLVPSFGSLICCLSL